MKIGDKVSYKGKIAFIRRIGIKKIEIQVKTGYLIVKKENIISI